jgi:HAE1 family hydrophobic/amphiphilic exporter-1
MGMNAEEASIKGATEIAVAVAASALTNVVVFLPMAFTKGIVGQFFYPFGLTVTFATLFSLVIAFTLTPMLAAKLLEKRRKGYGFDLFVLSILTILISAGVLYLSFLARMVFLTRIGIWSSIIFITIGLGFSAYLGKLILGADYEKLQLIKLYRIWRFLIKAVLVIITLGLIFVALLYLFGMIPAVVIISLGIIIIIFQRAFHSLDAFARGWDRFYDGLKTDYEKGLDWLLNHKSLIFGTVVLLLFASLFLSKFIGFEFMTQGDRGYISVSVEMPPGTNFDQTNNTLLQVEKILQETPEIESNYTLVGQSTSSSMSSNIGVQYGEIIVKLIPVSERKVRTKVVAQNLQKRLTKIPSADIRVTERSSGGTAGGGRGGGITIEITGEDVSIIKNISREVVTIAQATPGLVDVRSDWQEGLPEMQIIPDRKKLADHGISLLNLTTALRASIDGTIATEYRVGNEEYDVRVQLDKSSLKLSENIKNIYIKKESNYIPITELVTIQQKEGPTGISRKNKNRLITISGTVVNRSSGEIVRDIKLKTDKLAFPTGYAVNFAGMEQMRVEAFGQLTRTLILAIILTFILLAAIMESVIHPLIIMVTLPLGLIGAIIALIITGKTLNMISFMAIVMLVGIVVNNAILQIDYINTLRKEGKSLRQAIIAGASVRMRPIIMTNVATIISMIPLAMELGEGSEMRSSMAVVSIGALITSTLLTLFAIPAMYEIIEIIRSKKEAVPVE